VLKACEILGVKPLSSWREIEALYRRRAKELHPDRGGDPEEMAQLNWAFDRLREYIFNYRFKFTPEEIGAQFPKQEWDLWES
jgi:hypothetical protein